MKEWAYLELEAVPDMTRKYEIEYKEEAEWIPFDGNILTAIGGLYHENGEFRYREKQTYDSAFEEALKKANNYVEQAETYVMFDDIILEVAKVGFNAGYMFARGER